MGHKREITGVAIIDEAGKVCDRHGLVCIGPTLAYPVAQVLLELEKEIERLRKQLDEYEALEWGVADSL